MELTYPEGYSRGRCSPDCMWDERRAASISLGACRCSRGARGACPAHSFDDAFERRLAAIPLVNLPNGPADGRASLAPLSGRMP